VVTGVVLVERVVVLLVVRVRVVVVVGPAAFVGVVVVGVAVSRGDLEGGGADRPEFYGVQGDRLELGSSEGRLLSHSIHS
jgi:hypothetical protein